MFKKGFLSKGKKDRGRKRPAPDQAQSAAKEGGGRGATWELGGSGASQLAQPAQARALACVFEYLPQAAQVCKWARSVHYFANPQRLRAAAVTSLVITIEQHEARARGEVENAWRQCRDQLLQVARGQRATPASAGEGEEGADARRNFDLARYARPIFPVIYSLYFDPQPCTLQFRRGPGASGDAAAAEAADGATAASVFYALPVHPAVLHLAAFCGFPGALRMLLLLSRRAAEVAPAGAESPDSADAADLAVPRIRDIAPVPGDGEEEGEQGGEGAGAPAARAGLDADRATAAALAFDPSRFENAPLRHAVRMGHASAVRALLQDGRADPTMPGVLDGACVVGHVPVIRALLADPRVRPGTPTDGGCSVMEAGGALLSAMAIAEQPDAVAAVLFSQHMPVTPAVVRTAFAYAAHMLHGSIVHELLLQWPPTRAVALAEPDTTLAAAARSGCFHAVHSVLGHIGGSLRASLPEDPAEAAAAFADRRRRASGGASLLPEGADVPTEAPLLRCPAPDAGERHGAKAAGGPTGTTPATTVAAARTLAAAPPLRALLAPLGPEALGRGQPEAPPDVVRRAVGQAFMAACEHGFVRIAALLMAQCPREVDPAAEESRALRAACSRGHAAVASLLLQDRRADPAARDSEALRLACAQGHIEVVELLLLDCRADPNARDDEALASAEAAGHEQLIDIIDTARRFRPLYLLPYVLKEAPHL